MLDFVAGIFPSWRRMSRFVIYRDDGPLAFLEMSEAENRAVPVLDVVARGHRDAAVTQLLAGGKQSVARMDLGAELLSERVQRSFRVDAFGAKPANQRPHVVLAAINAIGRIEGRRWRVALDDKVALAPGVYPRKTSSNSGSTRTSPSELCDFGR